MHQQHLSACVHAAAVVSPRKMSRMALSHPSKCAAPAVMALVFADHVAHAVVDQTLRIPVAAAALGVLLLVARLLCTKEFLFRWCKLTIYV